MGKITDGILGGFSGTVGTVVGAAWRGIEYMRGRSKKRSGNPVQSQLDQQAKFALMLKFMRPLRGLVDSTFKNYAINMTAANYALSSNLNGAITGDFPDFSVDCSKVVLSHGTVGPALMPLATAGAGSKVNFTWKDTTLLSIDAKPDDQAILVAYDMEDNYCLYSMKGGKRSEETALLDLTLLSGKTVQTWLCFTSADGKRFSDSQFTGEVTVS